MTLMMTTNDDVRSLNKHSTAQHSLLIRLCLAIQMGKCRWLRSRLIIIICSFDLCEVTLLWHPTIDVAHLSPYTFFTLQAPRQNSTPVAEWGTQHLLLFVLSYLFALPLYLRIHRSVVGIAPLGRTVATNAECVHAATFLRILRKFWVFTRAPNEQLMSLRTARLDRFDGWFSGRWREMDNVFVISAAVLPIDRQILIRNIYSMTIFFCEWVVHHHCHETKRHSGGRIWLLFICLFLGIMGFRLE